MYKRVLLKLSGESLGGPAGKGLETASLSAYAKEIAAAAKAGLQIAIVNGGGNIFRGLQGVGKGFDRVDGLLFRPSRRLSSLLYRPEHHSAPALWV